MASTFFFFPLVLLLFQHIYSIFIGLLCFGFNWVLSPRWSHVGENNFGQRKFRIVLNNLVVGRAYYSSDYYLTFFSILQCNLQTKFSIEQALFDVQLHFLSKTLYLHFLKYLCQNICPKKKRFNDACCRYAFIQQVIKSEVHCLYHTFHFKRNYIDFLLYCPRWMWFVSSNLTYFTV